MSNIQKIFQESLLTYQSKKEFLPAKISWKLDLIVTLIQGNTIKKQMMALEQQVQYEDLKQSDDLNLKLLFNNIIETLFYKDEVQIQKCLIKKKGFLSNWIVASINYNYQNFLITYSNKTHLFECVECAVKKSKQSSRCFQFLYKKGHKYTMKFQNEQQMKKVISLWQRQIIGANAKTNYEKMSTLANQRESTELQMRKLNLITFQDQAPADYYNKSLNIDFMSKLVTKRNPGESPQHRKALSKREAFHSPLKYKKSPFQATSSPKKNHTFKPVPCGYIKEFQNDQIVVAMSEDKKAKIYVEYCFDKKIQFKRLITFFILQKTWNNHIVFENVSKMQSQKEILIKRKYDTFQLLGEFVQVNQKIMYTSWSKNMCMIKTQSIIIPDEPNSYETKSFITIEFQNEKLKIFVQQEIKSSNYSKQILRQILMTMHKQLLKLEILCDTIKIRNFQAETIVQRLLQDQDEPTTQSQEQVYSPECALFRSNKNFQNNQSIAQKGKCDKINQPDMDQLILQNPYQQNLSELQTLSTVRVPQVQPQYPFLQSPMQIPDQQYIKFIKNNDYEREYFKFKFSQQIQPAFHDYIPYYQLQKMVEDKIYQITPSGQMKFIDQKLIDSQKQVLRFVLRQIGANIISGKSVLNVSLPVEIFEPRTGLERNAASFGTCPDFLLPHAQSNVVEQMKYVTGFLINVTKSELAMQKPFNPILGQTFQGSIKGIPIYVQQISHHPPISSYFLKCPQFSIYGNFIPYVDVGINSGAGGNSGAMNIVFKNGSHFECYFPTSQISGLIYGDRKFKTYAKGFVFQRKSLLFSQFSYNAQKKGVYQSSEKLRTGGIIGGIYKIKPQFLEYVENYRAKHKNLRKFQGITKQYIEQELHSLRGEWFNNIYFSNQVINKDIKLYPVEYPKLVLPSNSNFRTDIVYHKLGDLNTSQKQKQILQTSQRQQKKLRDKHNKTLKPKK